MTTVGLVEAWLEHYAKQGLTKAVALRELNAFLGTRYQHGHLSRWERGVREPSLEARRRMAYTVVKDEHPTWDERQVKAFLNRYFA
jgi:transcriptional regulator with XRE-family HTH domain